MRPESSRPRPHGYRSPELFTRCCDNCRAAPRTPAQVADLEVMWLVDGLGDAPAPARYCRACQPRGEIGTWECDQCCDGAAAGRALGPPRRSVHRRSVRPVAPRDRMEQVWAALPGVRRPPPRPAPPTVRRLNESGRSASTRRGSLGGGRLEPGANTTVDAVEFLDQGLTPASSTGPARALARPGRPRTGRDERH